MKKSLRLNKVFFVVLFQSILVSSYIPFSNNHFLCMVELDMLRDQILPVFDFVRSAYVPSDANIAIAVGLSEAVAGAIGGLLSRGTARVVGDQKKDSIGTKSCDDFNIFRSAGFHYYNLQPVGYATSRVLYIVRIDKFLFG